MEFITKNFNRISAKERKKIVQGSVIPRPIAWVSSLNSDDSINLAPFSYFSMLSPSMVSVSVLRDAGIMKDTSRNVLKNREAVIHISDITLIEELDLSSKRFLENESEVDITKLTLVDSKTIKTKGILEAKIRLEVVLEKHIELIDFNGTDIEADLLIFRVNFAHLKKEVFDEEKGYVLHEKLRPLARLSGPSYAEIVEVKDFKRNY